MAKNELSDKQKECSIQEMDRKRIARELHDTSLQTLAHLCHQIELASLYIDKDPINAKLELAVVRKDLNAVIDEIRDTIFDLRPMVFDDLGMYECLQRLFASIAYRASFDIKDTIRSDLEFDEYTSLTIFRILQECLTNVKKHASCKHVKVSLIDRDNVLHMTIEDDGKGFSFDEIKEKENHYGFAILRERVESINGKIKISSEVDKGTTISVLIPK